MSDNMPTNFTSWYQNLPIPWLVGGPNGLAEATALGAVLDQQVALVKLATKAHFPDYAPTDALPHIGGDRQLEQGPNETSANFVTRLKTAWDDWARAGTALELLVQLYWDGFPGAVIAQQNGLLYSLSAAPTAGVDPTSLLQINLAMPNPTLPNPAGPTILITVTTGGVLGSGAVFSYSVNGSAPATLTYTLANAYSVYLQVPGTDTWLYLPAGTYGLGGTFTLSSAGASSYTGTGPIASVAAYPPWWTVDAHTAHTARFVVLFPGYSLGGSSAFVTSATVTFTGTEDGSTANPWPVATWNNAFADTTYKVIVGAVYSTDPAAVSANPTTKTLTTVGLMASGPFVGTVDVLAYEAGSNPFADIHAADLARLRRLINRWRPAKAICGGIYQVTRLPVWDYAPGRTWDDGVTNWDSGASALYGA